QEDEEKDEAVEEHALERLRVTDLGDGDAEDLDRPPRSVSRPAGMLVEAARPRVVLEHPEDSLLVAELPQAVLAGLNECAAETCSPVRRQHVDGVELAVCIRVDGRADRGEADDLAVRLCDERWRPAMHLRTALDALRRETLQFLARKHVLVGHAPGLDVNQGHGLGFLGCGGADHPAEPTLPAGAARPHGRAAASTRTSTRCREPSKCSPVSCAWRTHRWRTQALE